MKARFEGSRLKIKRANKHIQEFERIRADFLKGDFYRLSSEPNSKIGGYVLGFEASEVPSCVPLVIGDAIHNLHSALDIMAFAIVANTGAKPTKDIDFPFSKTRDGLVGMLKGREIKIAGKTILDIILDEVKPYPGSAGGNDAIYSLHLLDIMDKHQLLIPAVTIAQITGVDAKSGGMTLVNMTVGVSQGGKVNAVGSAVPFEITNKGHATAEITFHKAGVFQGEAVLPTLKQLSQLVSGIVDTIEKTYLSASEI